MASTIIEWKKDMVRLSLGDRRMFRRFEIGFSAELMIDGEHFESRIIDLSFGGANISSGHESWKLRTITLSTWDFGAETSLNGVVVGFDEGRCHIRFELDADGEKAFTLFLKNNKKNFIKT